MFIVAFQLNLFNLGKSADNPRNLRMNLFASITVSKLLFSLVF